LSIKNTQANVSIEKNGVKMKNNRKLINHTLLILSNSWNNLVQFIKSNEHFGVHLSIFFSPIKRLRLTESIKNGLVQTEYRTFDYCFNNFEDITSEHTLEDLSNISNICLNVFRHHFKSRDINYELLANYYSRFIYNIPGIYCLKLADDHVLKNRLKLELQHLKVDCKVSDDSMNSLVSTLFNCYINQRVNGSFSEKLNHEVEFKLSNKITFSRSADSSNKRNIW
jgi:hypothetical protein